jgi:hypothetical protein
MIAGSTFLEEFRQSKFRETVNLLKELDAMDNRGISSISKYNLRISDENYRWVVVYL